jgi:hypothetical protein
MEKFFNLICSGASLYVMYVGLVSLNRMSKETNNTVRYAFIILTVGALCNILILWHPAAWKTKESWGFEIYDLLNVFWTVGVAVFVGANTRRRALLEGELDEARTNPHDVH